MKKKEQTLVVDVVYGVHPVIELLKARRRGVQRIYTTDPAPKVFNNIKQLIPPHIPLSFVKKEVLTRLADTTDHQGIVALANPFSYRRKPFDPAHAPFLVLIDSVQDTRNLGGILRSAYCTNVSGVVTAGKQSAPINGSTCKASAGLVEHLEVYQAPTAIFAAKELRDAGYNLYLGAFGGTHALEIDFKLPACIVVGNEATGISPEILKLGTIVTLPQKRADISYNASVAAGILLLLASSKNKLIS